MRRIWFALALLGLNGALCTGPWPWDRETKQTNREAILARFTSADEMLTFLSDQVAEQAVSAPTYYYYDSVGVVGLTSANSGASSGTSNSASDSFSTTNLQESGVDESDLVKNDGTYIYLAKGASLRVIQAVPADAVHQAGSVALEGRATGLYLHGNQIIALGDGNGSAPSVVTLIDVSDRMQPTILRTWRFGASLVTSRLIGGKLHLVLTSTPAIQYGSDYKPLAWNSLDQVLPTYETSAPGETPVSGPIADWSSFYHPSDSEGYSFTIIATLDLVDPAAAPQSAGITASGGIVYASTSALYVTSPQMGWWYSRMTTDETTIHKFGLTGEQAVYTGSGVVSGHLLNQYSLGEKDGYLRVGVTSGQVSRTGDGTARNAVYVLGDSATEGQLDIVGKVEDIAPGEKIYSARFVGDRGFLVTFKKVDPLYTLDMSDPTNPRVVGQLKVPGYSDYIHPMDANHLLTIGKDAYDMGSFAWYQGVQLSIFDVTDFANPQLLAKEIIGVRGTDSEANQNPKAFNYFPVQNALAIPITLYEGTTSSPSEYGQRTFGGLYVYRATVDSGFSLLGRMNTEPGLPPNSYYYYSLSSFTRGIFIGDTVYAVSDRMVIAAPTANPAQALSSLTLP